MRRRRRCTRSRPRQRQTAINLRIRHSPLFASQPHLCGPGSRGAPTQISQIRTPSMFAHRPFHRRFHLCIGRAAGRRVRPQPGRGPGQRSPRHRTRPAAWPIDADPPKASAASLGRDQPATPGSGHVQISRTRSRRIWTGLADLLSSEHGKVIADAKGDVQRGLEVIEMPIRRRSKANIRRARAPGSTSIRCASHSASEPDAALQFPR